MGQTDSNLYTQTYGGYFRPKFDSAITYNKTAGGSNTSYQGVTQGQTNTITEYNADTAPHKTFQQVMQIFDMLKNDQSDDLITYLLILQSNPINIILQGQNMTSYNFNVAYKTKKEGDPAVDVLDPATSPDNMLERATDTKIMPICVNVTGAPGGITPETLGDTINSYNAWMLSSDGKIHYVINSQGDGDAQRVDWFNSLDNIQNQYIQYLFNTRNPTQSYIKMLVNQADLTYSNYASVLTDLLEKRVKNITVLSQKDVISVYMQKPDTNEKVKLRLDLGDYGDIEKAYFGNGEKIYVDIDADGQQTIGFKNDTMQYLGYYGYDLSSSAIENTLSNLNKDKVYNKENVGKVWRCLWNGQWYSLVYSPTYYSSTAVYHLIPLDDLLRLVYNNGH